MALGKSLKFHMPHMPISKLNSFPQPVSPGFGVFYQHRRSRVPPQHPREQCSHASVPSIWSRDCPGPRADSHSTLRVPRSARRAALVAWDTSFPDLSCPCPCSCRALGSTAGAGTAFCCCQRCCTSRWDSTPLAELPNPAVGLPIMLTQLFPSVGVLLSQGHARSPSIAE